MKQLQCAVQAPDCECAEHGHSHGEHAHKDGCETGAGRSASQRDTSMPSNQALQAGAERPAEGIAQKSTYVLEGLGCANCAAKMEERISALPGVEYAVISFPTKQLHIAAPDLDALLGQIGKICREIEPEVRVTEYKTAGRQESAEPPRRSYELAVIAAGAAIFALGELAGRLPAAPVLPNLLFLCAYLLLGGGILRKAGRNLLKGQIFDENFLMSIATLGAVALQNYPEAVGVMLFFRIGEYFEHRAVERSRAEIRGAVDLRPETVNLLVGEQTHSIAAADAQVGDILLVRAGDRIPLDGTVVGGESRLDTSPVTGEPVPVGVGKGSEVLSGCMNISGLLKVRVEKLLEESMVSRILSSVENAAAEKPKIDRFITRFAKVYTPIVLLIALGVAIVPSLIVGNARHWIYTALTFLVISCPCALVLSVPLAFFAGIGAGSRRGILFKSGAVIEALNNIKAVVMDKTGTITTGEFAVREIIPEENMSERELLALAASCEAGSTHPIAVSITAAARERGIALEQPKELREEAGLGIVAELNAGRALCGNERLLRQNGAYLPDAADREDAGTQVWLALDGRFAGRIVISDRIKPEAAAAVQAMKKRGLATVMLTGDTQRRAADVAEQVGVDEVFARLLPEEKVTELHRVRAAHGEVLFVGDGINDAPVLAAADVGAAMGSGADAAIEVADMVFMRSGLDAVSESIEIAKETTRIAWQNVLLALGIKLAVMVLGLAGYASMWMAVFADTGVSMLCVLNSVRILYRKNAQD